MQNKDALNDSYVEMNKLRIEEKKKQLTTEFIRYKQDCRKRALELAHQQLTTSVFQNYIENNSLLPNEGSNTVTDKSPIIADELLIALADKYYNWLISIPNE